MRAPFPFTTLDIESTGTDPYEDQIVELGLAEFSPHLDQPKTLARRFKPGLPISKGAAAVHGITNDAVQGLKPFPPSAPKLLQYLQARIIVGYNLYAFDCRMLAAEFARAGIPRPFESIVFIDVYPFVKEDYGQKRRPASKSLEDQCAWFGIELANAHSAAQDAEATGWLLLAMMQWPIENPLIPCIERVIEMQSGLRRRLETPVQLEMGV